uniref:Uncharacterized protein n=1 Tax=Chromera velia CCMP2878 TaxID=1169474 RepID=A0A0G4FUJ3_9ALVE|eukprot:Cvel_18854.t1-p1 / transcript=Cvel_18854.t1 / gene=Cvel_18854 / organism=Chromera_velia_CCMP2878 / gene_product=hypothetical protein / transcript_product=hypothetical protein / location=Cvel_scaffold1585:30838-32114(+) / protein_length=179 / sequence_SO=supercontig / SO=protein_coding / is_pseudo=false
MQDPTILHALLSDCSALLCSFFQEAHRHWTEMARGTYNWERKWQEAEVVLSLTPEDLTTFVKTFLTLSVPASEEATHKVRALEVVVNAGSEVGVKKQQAKPTLSASVSLAPQTPKVKIKATSEPGSKVVEGITIEVSPPSEAEEEEAQDSAHLEDDLKILAMKKGLEAFPGMAFKPVPK